MKNLVKLIVVSCALLSLVACATIMGDKTQLMSINSTPSDAVVKIKDEKGMEIFTGKTPTNVTLQKADGSYWGGKDYIVTISKDGYETQVIPVVSSPNGWYIAGNLVFGGLIGWFIVDPLTGAMYNLSPEQINASLSTKVSHNNTSIDGNISILLLEDVPLQLRDKMTRIN
ncbi:MAG: hypothetical protein AVO39_10625 [delta proteobacterium MLS_D]|jgi:hypothetical protein|nr:MAG: hypothetical protein AVO39_10625 [delta proteobacterium MLS_D]